MDRFVVWMDQMQAYFLQLDRQLTPSVAVHIRVTANKCQNNQFNSR